MPAVVIPPHRSADADKESRRRQKHAVVIGSGFGGLAAAVRLGVRGYRVTVLEKCDTPGGRARVFRQDGFSFDAGPPIITGPFLFDKLWEMCGRRLADDVELRPVAPFYRIRFEDGRVLDYIGDPEAMRREVAKFEPSDVVGYNRFLQTSQETCRIGFEERGHVSFARWQTMAVMVPKMLGANAHRSVAFVVASHFKNLQLRIVFSFHPLLIGGNPIASRHRKRRTDRRIAKAKYSMSLFGWYFGINRQYPDVAHNTILLGERFKGLLADIFRHHRLADDFSLYLHRPTATDPSLAPDGCDTFYVLSPVPHLDSGTDWAERADSYRRSIAAYLSATVLPGLEGAVVSSKVMTPQDFHDDLLSNKGAAFSLEPVITQTAYFRPHNKSEEIGNLFLVGAGTHPGAGVPGVLSSARVLDEVVPYANALV